MKSWRNWHKGQSAVELALAAPILAVLLVVATDYARAFYMSVELDNAARAGAQYASQSTTTAADSSGIISAAKLGAPDISGMTVTTSACTCVSPVPSGQSACPSSYCTNSPSANYIEVDTKDNFTMVLNFNNFGNVVKGFKGPTSTIPLTAKAIMQVQE